MISIPSFISSTYKWCQYHSISIRKYPKMKFLLRMCVTSAPTSSNCLRSKSGTARHSEEESDSPTQDVWLELGFLISTHWLSLSTPRDHLRGTSCVLCYITCFYFLVEFQGWYLTQDIIPVVRKEAQRGKSYKDTQRAASLAFSKPWSLSPSKRLPSFP